jgi:hypothetical protein
MGNSHIFKDTQLSKNKNTIRLNEAQIKQNFDNYYIKLHKKNAFKKYPTKSNYNITRQDAVLYYDNLSYLSKKSCLNKKSNFVKSFNHYNIEVLLKEINQSSNEIKNLLSLNIGETLPIFLKNFEQNKKSNFCKNKKDNFEELEKISESLLTINNSFITENKGFSSILKDESYLDWLNKESFDEIASEMKEDTSQKTTSVSNLDQVTMNKQIRKNKNISQNNEHEPLLIKIDIRPYISQNQKCEHNSQIDLSNSNNNFDSSKSMIPEIKNLKVNSNFSRK